MQIVYEDNDMIICDKEAGLPVQTGNIRQKDLTDILRGYLQEKEMDKNGGKPVKEPYLGIIHRIDQPVRGITVFAKHAKAAAQLSTQINSGKMKKTYLAFVNVQTKDAKAVFAKEGRLTDYLLKDVKSNSSKVVPEKTNGAKKAELTYSISKIDPMTVFPELDRDHVRKVLQTGECLLLEIHLLTGRHHQIRVQLSHAGVPIIGDHKYAAEDADHVKYPCLCAYRLELDHPGTGKRMIFQV